MRFVWEIPDEGRVLVDLIVVDGLADEPVGWFAEPIDVEVAKDKIQMKIAVVKMTLAWWFFVNVMLRLVLEWRL